MEERGNFMKKIGRYTAALLLIGTGCLLFSDLLLNTRYLADALQWWPVLLIALGLEYLLSAGSARGGNTTVRLAYGQLAAAAIISLGVIAYAGGAIVPFSSLKGQKYDKDPVLVTLDGIEAIHLENMTGGDLIVQSANVSRMSLEATVYVGWLSGTRAKQIADSFDIEVDRDGGTLHIEAKKNSRGFWEQALVTLTVTVPEREIGEMRLMTRNGRVRTTGLSAAGRLSVETTNGSIEAANIVGNLEAHSTNGSITVNGIHGDARLETTNGKIDIDGASGKLSARTTNGVITAASSRVGGDWDLKTTNSAIRLKLPEQGDYTVDGSTTHAKITSDLPLQVDGNDVSGKIGAGTHKIRLSTTNGAIRIEAASVSG